MRRTRWLIALTLALAAPIVNGKRPAPAIFVYGSASGADTRDDDSHGGNPFATALIEVLSLKELSFQDFKTKLPVATQRSSDGFQQAEVVGGDGLTGLLFRPKEKKVALVVVFSTYSAFAGERSLPGAKRDADRITKALLARGVRVTTAVDPDRDALERLLDDFGRESAKANLAAIYTTGHGVEYEGEARIILPYSRRNAGRWLSVRELSTTCRATRVNLVFYAACRTRVAGLKPSP